MGKSNFIYTKSTLSMFVCYATWHCLFVELFVFDFVISAIFCCCNWSKVQIMAYCDITCFTMVWQFEYLHDCTVAAETYNCCLF